MPRQACCSSPRAIRYWFFASLASWVVIGLGGTYWHPLRFQSAAAILFALAAGCFANWFRNRTLHCAMTGPLFLIAGLLSLLSELLSFRLPDLLFYLVLLCGVAIAFLLERRFART
jgi:hypothetical protein